MLGGYGILTSLTLVTHPVACALEAGWLKKNGVNYFEGCMDGSYEDVWKSFKSCSVNYCTKLSRPRQVPILGLSGKKKRVPTLDLPIEL